MPFVSREDIDLDVRAKYDKRYKAQLREALHNPGLTAEQRKHLQAQIRQVGQPKVYSADSAPKPGAFKAGESS